jgi:hypothetical protein
MEVVLLNFRKLLRALPDHGEKLQLMYGRVTAALGLDMELELEKDRDKDFGFYVNRGS